MEALRVVVVDDEPATCLFLQSVVNAEHHQCRTFLRPTDAERYVAENPVDLALIDVYMGSVNGIDLLRRMRGLQPGMHAVIMTAKISIETAAASIAEGAIDYIRKPIAIDELRALLAKTQARLSPESRSIAPPSEKPQESAIVGSSPKMLDVYKAIARVAPSDATVLITGASGTGKELVARAIHQHSKRAAQPFTPVNCGSFTETILEDELFGHEKGAFTGAEAPRKGLVEASDKGTLFLDEITETTLSFQVKLLRVIQEQQVRRIGSNRYVPVDVRILAASNQDLSGLIKEGRLREDLFYRLTVVRIDLPTLRERNEDIPLLVEHFLQQFNSKNELSVSIEPAAIRYLQGLTWPGNVRELENTVHRLAIFAATGAITLDDVKTEAERGRTEPVPEAAGAPDRLQEMERQHILRLLKETGGNKSETARRLGIERKTLYKKALRLGIDLLSIEKK
jgi:DNA-binding NtrC family response regulator